MHLLLGVQNPEKAFKQNTRTFFLMDQGKLKMFSAIKLIQVASRGNNMFSERAMMVFLVIQKGKSEDQSFNFPSAFHKIL